MEKTMEAITTYAKIVGRMYFLKSWEVKNGWKTMAVRNGSVVAFVSHQPSLEISISECSQKVEQICRSKE